MMAKNETQKGFDVARYGGKGAMLLILQEAGFPVPSFKVYGTDFFGEWWKQNDAGLISIRDFWNYAPFSKPAHQNNYAVRSSAVEEDSTEKSFAGQFKTLLNVQLEELVDAIIEVLLSVRSAAADTYRGGRGEQDLRMAVIVQEMIPATVSGVAFGAHPVSGEDVIVVNATAGLGEALVSGEVTGEQYLLQQAGDSISAPESGLLSAAQLTKIADCMARLQAHFGRPQDIEFAFVDDEFFLLQSRPITTIRGERTVWDNSNIVESYPGLTGPLTYSFIEKMYAAVYRQFSLVLGVSPRRVQAAEAVYANMLGLLNGRVYYNLASWYRALAQLPGYSLNAGFMEKMMGVKDKPEIDLGPPEQAVTRLGDVLRLIRALGAILKNLRGARQSRRAFEEKFNRVHARFAAKDYSAAPLGDILADYRTFETLMVQEWKAPLVNDFFAMIYFGLLQKQCSRLAPGDPTLHNRLLAASGDVATTAPLKRLPALAASLASAPSLREALTTGTPEAAWILLGQPEHILQKAELDRYLADWGERVAEELKLETTSYADDPVKLLAILQGYVRSGIFSVPAEDTQLRTEAEDVVRMALRGKPLKRRLFRHILRQARYFVSNRENLRYYRTRGFAVVRRMMLAAGAALTKTGTLEAPRDVFFLTLEEIQALQNDTSSQAQVQERVQHRKRDYARFAEERLPQRITSWGRPAQIIVARESEAAPQATGDGLQGIPCSPGLVRAQVRKVVSVESVADLGRSILATYATDPGYVVLFPSAAGILTERGSLLSHAAIVSREMNIPCIVGIEGLMTALTDGAWVEMDGSTGAVKIIEE